MNIAFMRYSADSDPAVVEHLLTCMETELNTTGQSAIVRSLNVEELSEWESLVRQSAQGTLFHSRLWLDALGEPYKLFGWFTGGQLRGGFAAGIVGPKAASAPYSALTPYLGLLFAEGDTKYVTRISTEKQISRAFAVFLKQHFNSVQFRFPPEIIDLQPFIWEGFQIQLRYTYRLELRDIDAMLANMDKRCRRDLVAAEKQGIKIESDVPFTEVLPLCEMSLKRSGVETSALMVAERVEAVLRHAGRCRGFLARSREKTPLGAVWIVWDEKRAYYLLGGYSDPMKSGNAVALALWHAIQFTALDLRLSEFDFEGSMVPAIERFFRKFGGTIKPTYTVHYEKRISPLQRLWGKALSHFKKD